MATINPDKLKQNLTALVLKIDRAGKEAIQIGLNDFQAELLTRIFQRGEDNSGNSIGKYSTKPIYVSLDGDSQKRTSGLFPQGKERGSRAAKRTKTKNIKNKFTGKMIKGDRTSMYLPGGYFEYRKLVGRQNEKVDLAVTFSLRNSIQQGNENGNKVIAFNNDNEFKKAQGNEDRFDKVIFSGSNKELDIIEDIWASAVEDAFFSSFE